MLLDALATYATVESAAKNLAGNYKLWRNFAWLGEYSTPNAQNVMLGYIVNNIQGDHVTELANLRFLQEILKPYFGDIRQNALVDNFGSSFCGDKGAFSGLAVRVYHNGEITAPFRILYHLARKHRNGVLDKETFEQVRTEEITKFVTMTLNWLAVEKKKPSLATEETVAMVVRELEMEGTDYEELTDEKVEEMLVQFGEIEGPDKTDTD